MILTLVNVSRYDEILMKDLNQLMQDFHELQSEGFLARRLQSQRKICMIHIKVCEHIPYISNSKTVFTLIHTTIIENYDDREYTIMKNIRKTGALVT